MKGFLLRDAGCEARVAFFAQRMLATARRRLAMKANFIPKPVAQDNPCLLARLLADLDEKKLNTKGTKAFCPQ